MTWTVARQWLGPGRLLVQCGPMHMAIEARRGDEPDLAAVEAAVSSALSGLADVAAHRSLCRRWIAEVEPSPALPAVVLEMIRAAAATGEPKITPMAAVAGSIADAAADAAARAGATRVICNNGGDIAVRLAPGESVWVGLHRGLGHRSLAGRLLIRGGNGIGGICTSGLGGRSLTRGIASAVSAFGPRAADADAAATLIANHVYVAHPGVRQVPAEQVEPDTDIPGLSVTVAVGDLPQEAWAAAGSRGMAEADRLRSRGLIQGAVLFAGPWSGHTPALIPGLEWLPSRKEALDPWRK